MRGGIRLFGEGLSLSKQCCLTCALIIRTWLRTSLIRDILECDANTIVSHSLVAIFFFFNKLSQWDHVFPFSVKLLWLQGVLCDCTEQLQDVGFFLSMPKLHFLQFNLCRNYLKNVSCCLENACLLHVFTLDQKCWLEEEEEEQSWQKADGSGLRMSCTFVDTDYYIKTYIILPLYHMWAKYIPVVCKC